MRLLFARRCDQYADMTPVCQEVTPSSRWRDSTERGFPALGQDPNKGPQESEAIMMWLMSATVRYESKNIKTSHRVTSLVGATVQYNERIRRSCSKSYLWEDWCRVQFTGFRILAGPTQRSNLSKHLTTPLRLRETREVPPSSQTTKTLLVTFRLMTG